MDVWVSEIKCLLCGHVAGYSVAQRGAAGLSPVMVQGGAVPPQRCPRCGGRLYLDPATEHPRELGLAVPNLGTRAEHEQAAEASAERHCISCGAPVQRAERCRRCYLRHRYATNPDVRAKQLSLQAEWRKRQAAAQG
ncbi:MAG: hypothetical protein HY690_14530 [Chloroflexi bacterium]|nr:hypothetical protein [Chloroflexota bacterium]